MLKILNVKKLHLNRTKHDNDDIVLKIALNIKE